MNFQSRPHTAFSWTVLIVFIVVFLILYYIPTDGLVEVSELKKRIPLLSELKFDAVWLGHTIIILVFLNHFRLWSSVTFVSSGNSFSLRDENRMIKFGTWKRTEAMEYLGKLLTLTVAAFAAVWNKPFILMFILCLQFIIIMLYNLMLFEQLKAGFFRAKYFFILAVDLLSAFFIALILYSAGFVELYNNNSLILFVAMTFICIAITTFILHLVLYHLGAGKRNPSNYSKSLKEIMQNFLVTAVFSLIPLIILFLIIMFYEHFTDGNNNITKITLVLFGLFTAFVIMEFFTHYKKTFAIFLSNEKGISKEQFSNAKIKTDQKELKLTIDDIDFVLMNKAEKELQEKAIDEAFNRRHKTNNFESILEVGFGEGFSYNAIRSKIDVANTTHIVLELNKEIFKNCEDDNIEIRNIDWETYLTCNESDKKFDFVYFDANPPSHHCNLNLHNSKNVERWIELPLRIFRKHLNDKGIFVFLDFSCAFREKEKDHFDYGDGDYTITSEKIDFPLSHNSHVKKNNKQVDKVCVVICEWKQK